MSKIKKLVIPVAGLGTRFLPVTKTIPKVMLPIVDKPALQLLLEEAIDSDIEEVLLIINDSQQSVLDYFKHNLKLDNKLNNNPLESKLNEIYNISSKLKLSYVIQKKPLGTGNAIRISKKFVNDEAFAVMFCDDIIKGTPALKELINLYNIYDSNIIAIREIEKENISKYGILSFENIENNKINDLIEKPNIEEAPSNIASIGRYIFKPEIFNEIDKCNMENNEILLTDAMKKLMKYQSFYGCKFNGEYFDIGNQLGFMKANIAYSLERNELKDSLIKYLKIKGV